MTTFGSGFAAHAIILLSACVGCADAEPTGKTGRRLPETSNFGTISLALGFSPDPLVAEGSAGGAQRVREDGCTGWIATVPDHLLVLASDFEHLRIVVNSHPADTTLVVRTPSGDFRCDDDAGSGGNPALTGVFPRGEYALWVGSYAENSHARYRLAITTRPELSPLAIGSPNATVTFEPNGSVLRLLPGFETDPFVVHGTLGGPVFARTFQSDCLGWVTEAPAFTFHAAGHFSELRFVVRSEADATLVLRKPDESYVCDDDSGSGENPLIVGEFPPGDYTIWVGSLDEEVTAPYSLAITELAHITAAQLN